MNDNTLFSIQRLSFSYADTPVLSIPSLELVGETITVLVGGNGSGKTTFLKLLNGLLKDFTGSIRYKGEDIRKNNYARIRSESVYVHQTPYLFVGTVYQNVAYGLKIRGTPKPEIMHKTEAALTRLGLEGFEHRKAVDLSGGEKQRVALARALVLDPQIVFLDEPTANIDPLSTSLIEGIIKELPAAGKTVILSSHNPAFSYRICDRLIRLEEGKVMPNLVNILKGRKIKQDESFSYFQSMGQTIRCPAQEGDFSAAVIPLNDIILSEKRIHTSAQNQMEAVVVRISEHDSMYRISMDCGILLETLITGASLKQLRIETGKRLVVSFKAASVQLY